ncbi:YjcZ family sporulation protein [Alkalihalobacterium sp. APHAB7]|uniref:YjcZ family sporulation protein n=1 Tax=Alkalihalobacterium sp. APHAB7 TaxID=3402081 RepID=UPI003AB0552F
MYANVNAAPFMGANVSPMMMDNVSPMMMDNVPPTMTAPMAHHPYMAPSYGYGCPTPARGVDNFVLIVVLFILLIIVGASFTKY